MKKKFLSALLALCMVVALLPTAAFAAGEEESGEATPAPDKCSCGCTFGEGSCCSEAECGCSGADSPKCGNAACTLCADKQTPVERKPCSCTDAKCTKGHGAGGCEVTVPKDDGDGLCEDCATYAALPACTCVDPKCGHQGAPEKCTVKVTGSGTFCGICEENASKNQCTQEAGCTSPKHKSDCPVLCTMDDTCPNTPGRSAAHRTEYYIQEGAGLQGPFATLEDAQAAADNMNAGNEQYGTNWRVVTKTCPVAGAASGVVLGGGDEPAESAKPDKPTTPTREPGAPVKAEDFTDVPAGSWYAADLTTLMEQGIFVGQGKNFAPQSNTTGAEVVVLLSRVLGEELVTTGAAWSKEATDWAAKEGITAGIDISTTGELARKDLILMLWRAAGKPASSFGLERFSDVDGLEGDPLTALRWAVENGIVNGNPDGTVNPMGATKRCEMAALLVRYGAKTGK